MYKYIVMSKTGSSFIHEEVHADNFYVNSNTKLIIFECNGKEIYWASMYNLISIEKK